MVDQLTLAGGLCVRESWGVGKGSDSCPPIDGWAISHHLPAIPAAVRSSLHPREPRGSIVDEQGSPRELGLF